MNDNQPVRRNFWPRHVSWLTIALAILAVFTFIIISGYGVRYGGIPVPMGMGRGVVEYSSDSGVVTQTSGSVVMEAGGSSYPAQGKMMDSGIYYPYPYQNPNVSITDTREFLKISYNALMRTRDVQSLTSRVETVVRGYDGRIDQESNSPQYGYVSFVVPQSKYDAFRAELESLVSSRFITVNISSQNLLSQKVSIEEQQKKADAMLSEFQTARQKIVSNHLSIVKSLQAKIDASTQKSDILRAQAQTPEIISQTQTISSELESLKRQLENENASYTAQLSSADKNIKYAQDRQKAVQTQDQALLDDVATVTGTVSIQHISCWEIIRLYLPGYSIPAIFAVLAFLSLLYDRRRFGTV